jgi:hypothetical protein
MLAPCNDRASARNVPPGTPLANTLACKAIEALLEANGARRSTLSSVQSDVKEWSGASTRRPPRCGRAASSAVGGIAFLINLVQLPGARTVSA